MRSKVARDVPSLTQHGSRALYTYSCTQARNIRANERCGRRKGLEPEVRRGSDEIRSHERQEILERQENFGRHMNHEKHENLERHGSHKRQIFRDACPGDITMSDTIVERHKMYERNKSHGRNENLESHDSHVIRDTKAIPRHESRDT